MVPPLEEEITTVVKNAVHSYKDLPLRLYQVSRKYRDEARPRQGLLRGREFVMKDLYTFDLTEEQAMKTYDAVSLAYRAFLDETKLPYLVANADSGNDIGRSQLLKLREMWGQIFSPCASVMLGLQSTLV